MSIPGQNQSKPSPKDDKILRKQQEAKSKRKLNRLY